MSKKLVVLCIALCGVMAVPGGTASAADLVAGVAGATELTASGGAAAVEAGAVAGAEVTAGEAAVGLADDVAAQTWDDAGTLVTRRATTEVAEEATKKAGGAVLGRLLPRFIPYAAGAYTAYEVGQAAYEGWIKPEIDEWVGERRHQRIMDAIEELSDEGERGQGFGATVVASGVSAAPADAAEPWRSTYPPDPSVVPEIEEKSRRYQELSEKVHGPPFPGVNQDAYRRWQDEQRGRSLEDQRRDIEELDRLNGDLQRLINRRYGWPPDMKWEIKITPRN